MALLPTIAGAAAECGKMYHYFQFRRTRHPEIHRAIAALRSARGHLQEAAHDFGGHKADAIRATDEAIRQLEICLKYDKD